MRRNAYGDIGKGSRRGDNSMAIMIPEDISSYNYTESEKEVYLLLKEQLPSHFTVYFSVSWIEKSNATGAPQKGEADFLICSPHLGCLSLEVKGGIGLDINKNGDWVLKLNNHGERRLKRSPFKQAELSSYYFKDLYESTTNKTFFGTYCHAVCFPNFNFDDKDVGPDAPREIVIDATDISVIGKRIIEIFNFWRRKDVKANIRKDYDAFLNAVSVTRWYEVVYSRKLKEHKEIFESINRVQDNYLDLTENFNETLFVGGAGTGKTWCAMKKAVRLKSAGHNVLMLCYNAHLADFISKQIQTDGLKVSSFHSLMSQLLGNKKFDELKRFSWEMPGIFDALSILDGEGRLPKFSAIIIDEGQDFCDEWALSLRLLLKNEKEGLLHVFYDPNQDIFGRSTGVDFEKIFSIKYPAFRLMENLRNTAAIHLWSSEKTGVGNDVKKNALDGISPQEYNCETPKEAGKKLETLLSKLIDDQCIDKRNIVVLSDRTLEGSFLAGATKIGRFRLYENTENSANPNAVTYKTVQSFKGLEADVVILLMHAGANNNGQGKNNYLKYVAYTRARYLLFVINV